MSQVERQVLDAASDDYESLEQIYRSVSLEFSAENYHPSNSQAFYWRAAINAPTLAEIAEAVIALLGKGYLEVRTEDQASVPIIADLSILWRGWFRTTDRGHDFLRGMNDSGIIQ